MSNRKKIAVTTVVALIIYAAYCFKAVSFLSYRHGNEEYPYPLPRLKNEETVEKEALNPDSQYFGMIFKPTYGIPVRKTNKFSFEAFINGLPHWLTYFPALSEGFEKYAKLNPSKNSTSFTSSALLIWLDNRTMYYVGDIFKVRLQAKDFLSRSKTFGGDYFRARLLKTISKEIRQTPLKDGIPCTVVDHCDGTYTIEASLSMEGTFMLEITLVLSVEGISRLHEWTAGRFHQGFTFVAALSSQESVHCNVDLSLYDKYKDKDLCDYSNPRNREPWFCECPPSGICFPIEFMQNVDHHINEPFDITSELSNTFHQYKTVIRSRVVVKRSPLENPNNIDSEKSFNNGILRSSGYSNHGRWVSLEHNYNHASLQDSIACFHNKVVYMFGDSTMRQFFNLVQENFQLDLKISNQTTYWFRPRMGRNAARNITIYMRGHGPPVNNPGTTDSRPYISDSFEGIEIGGKDVVFLLNLGLHLLEFDVNFYLHRLRGIKAAIIKHLKRFPDTKIIIKGMNVSNIPSRPFEWLIYRYDVLLRETFKDLKSVVFVDLHGMTSLWPLTADYHPPPTILMQQALLIFSYICD